MDALIAHQLCHGTGETTKMVNKFGFPDIMMIGITEMSRLPDDLHLLTWRGVDHWQKALPVVLAQGIFRIRCQRAPSRGGERMLLARGGVIFSGVSAATADRHLQPFTGVRQAVEQGESCLEKAAETGWDDSAGGRL